MKKKSDLTQVFGNIFGKLIFTDFQALCQFDDDFISLIQCQQTDDIFQAASRRMAYGDPLTDLQQVGKVGGDMKFFLPPAHPETIQQIFNINGFDDPGGSDLQVL